MVRGRRTAGPAEGKVRNALAVDRRRAGQARPRATVGRQAVLALQRSVGNAAVSALVAGRLRSPGERAVTDVGAALREVGRDGLVMDKALRVVGGRPIPRTTAEMAPQPSPIVVSLQVQRGGDSKLDSPSTLTWEVDDESEVRAKLVRHTKTEADAWGEVGPHPPRIKFGRTVELSTRDGRRARLRIGITVYLREGAKLPQSLEAAIATAGHGVRGHVDFDAEGGDLIPTRDPRWYEVSPGISMQALSSSFPPYAAWSMSAEQQEAAILRHLDTLPRRRPVEAEKEEGDKRSIAEKVAGAVSDMAPVTGNLKDAYRLAFGRDPDTNEKLGWGARILAGIFAIPGLGNALKWIGKPLRWLGRTTLVRRAADALRGRAQRLWKRLTGKKAPKALPSATPRLTVGQGHEMLRESLEHLKHAPPGRRIEMFDDHVKQIEDATKGAWNATKSVLQDGTAVFVGTAGHTLVITAQGKVYKGMLTDPAHFTLGRGGIPIPKLHNLKEVM